MRDVAIASFAKFVTPKSERDEVEMLAPVITEALARAGVDRHQVGFTVSGSCDYLGGRPFSFVMALDAVGAWPPIAESHVEMDGAWALYEAWVRLQMGDIDSALVYAFGRSTQGNLDDVLQTQLDPYVVGPLAPTWGDLAAIQARALVDAGKWKDASVTPPRACDGASAIVLVAGDRAKKLGARAAWIRGIDHRIEASSIGARDLTRSRSTEIAAKKAGVAGGAIDVAEIHAPFAHQELLVKEALGLGEGVAINPSGGVREAHPYIVAGLNRIGEAAARVIEGSAKRAVAHATSGPCLQQNLVCVLEGARAS